MNINTQKVLDSLRRHSEGQEDDGWKDIYLDNAHPSDMSDKSFRSRLATLSNLGYYRPTDGYAFGRVKMTD